MSASFPNRLTRFLSDTERMTLRSAEADAANLPDRIAGNEAVWGPGARPELRARLADATITLARLERTALGRSDTEAAHAYDADTEPALYAATLTDGGKSHLHWRDAEPGWTLCGANRWDADPMGAEILFRGTVRLWEALDGRGASCARCTKSVNAWWNND
jgi:hypothetical protein